MDIKRYEDIYREMKAKDKNTPDEEIYKRWYTARMRALKKKKLTERLYGSR